MRIGQSPSNLPLTVSQQMSCHYNFTTGFSHSNNNMLAPIIPQFDVPPSGLFVYVHGLKQVSNSPGYSLENLLMNCHQ